MTHISVCRPPFLTQLSHHKWTKRLKLRQSLRAHLSASCPVKMLLLLKLIMVHPFKLICVMGFHFLSFASCNLCLVPNGNWGNHDHLQYKLYPQDTGLLRALLDKWYHNLHLCLKVDCKWNGPVNLDQNPLSCLPACIIFFLQVLMI